MSRVGSAARRTGRGAVRAGGGAIPQGPKNSFVLATDAARFSTRSRAADPSIPAPISPAPLTAEEQSLVDEGLLPASYAQLEAIARSQGRAAAIAYYRKGKTGPFSEDYGDPSSMLSAARGIARNPQLKQLLKDTQKGDILLIDYNDPNDFIASTTGGPFDHAILCTDSGPPPDFIEAVGVTGDPNDPSSNRVRRCGFNHDFSSNITYRRIRPADQLPPADRQQAIDAAVAYAENQLGKPYDYTFGQTRMGRAFYCSSLAYYAYVKGAGLQIPISKSSRRDTLIDALGSLTDALAPKDRLTVISGLFERVNRRPALSESRWVQYIVSDLLPNCYTTASLAKTPKEQAALATAIQKFQSGKGLPRYQAASRQEARDAKDGRFKTPILGAIRKMVDSARTGTAAFLDVYHAFDGTGLSRIQTLEAVRKLAWATLPYSEPLAALAFGRNSSRTKGITRFLDTCDWLKSHPPFAWVSGWLPSRATPRIDGSFISPTDLAWANLPHEDYNVKPGEHLDSPTVGPLTAVAA